MFMSLESPVNTLHAKKISPSVVFNSTISYMLSSDVVVPYGKTRPLQPTQASRKYTGDKNKTALWFISNCASEEAQFRLKFVKKLQKFIDVDIYGNCDEQGVEPDPCKKEKQCLASMAKHYYFYLSFENSLCLDYITEKFWRALNWTVVPVAMGGVSIEDYLKVAPPHSFIHVSQFSSVSELADRLKYLMNNHEEYNKYLEWTREYYAEVALSRHDTACQLCELAHAETEEKSTLQLTQWLNRSRLCTKKA
jgi:hypothetical protein